MPKTKLKFHTRICDILGVEYPIIQAGMGGFSDPPLVIAVSEAGGLGTLGSATYTADGLDAAIKSERAPRNPSPSTYCCRTLWKTWLV